MKVNGKTFRSQVIEKEEGGDMYDDAIADGNGAFMLENSNADGPYNTFTLSVGNILPAHFAIIMIKFVCKLVVKKNRFVYSIPIDQKLNSPSTSFLG